jgi:hypothetical protein
MRTCFSSTFYAVASCRNPFSTQRVSINRKEKKRIGITNPFSSKNYYLTRKEKKRKEKKKGILNLFSSKEFL